MSWAKAEAKAIRELDWRRVFTLLPRRMPDGRWAWLRWIEVRRSYYYAFRETRRWGSPTAR